MKFISSSDLDNRPNHLDGIRLSISCSGEIDNDGDTGENAQNDPAFSENTCAFCKTNFEGITLDKLSVYPICEPCKLNHNKKIFPFWVKLFFIGVIAIVIFSFFWNWRFYSAYINIKKANSAFAGSDVTKAASFMAYAANQVPESSEVKSLASYFKAVDLLRKDRSTEALAELEKCKDLSPDFHINELVLQAEMGSGFDKKDYNLFLTSAKAFLQLDTTKAESWGAVSSAYACLYAQNSADSSRKQALKYLGKAKARDDTSADAKEFYGRIQYRLDSRQIISKDQFDKKYPNGYTSK